MLRHCKVLKVLSIKCFESFVKLVLAIVNKLLLMISY